MVRRFGMALVVIGALVGVALGAGFLPLSKEAKPEEVSAPSPPPYSEDELGIVVRDIPRFFAEHSLFRGKKDLFYYLQGVIGEANPVLDGATKEKVAAYIIVAADRWRIDPLLLAAVINRESNFDPKAKSSQGALGLGQLMPKTALALGVDPLQIRENLFGSARYLRGLLDRFDGDKKKALAAYNAGPTVVAKRGPGVYAETRCYVHLVSRDYEERMLEWRMEQRRKRWDSEG